MTDSVFWLQGNSRRGADTTVFEYLLDLICVNELVPTVAEVHQHQYVALNQVVWLNDYKSCNTGKAYKWGVGLFATLTINHRSIKSLFAWSRGYFAFSYSFNVFRIL